MKKFISIVASVGMALSIFATPVYAQGDPVEEEVATDTLAENPEPEKEDDHTPLTYDGTGTVVDNVLNGSKQFYTISTDAGNVFYLIVDLDKENNNVYFLDTTKERDLIALAEKAEKDEGVAIVEEEPVAQAPEPEPEKVIEEPEVPKEAPKQSNTSLIIILILICMGGAGVVFYYWVYKPKKDRDEAEEFEEAYQFEEMTGQESSYDDSDE